MRIRLETVDLKELLKIRRRYQLDFDNAYQYVAAGKYNFTLVSFDSDFDHTELGRKQPSEV